MRKTEDFKKTEEIRKSEEIRKTEDRRYQLNEDEVNRKNDAPQSCHMTIAETLPEGLFDLKTSEQHLTIHQVCYSVFLQIKDLIKSHN